MVQLTLSQHLWENMGHVRIDAKLLETYVLQTKAGTQTSFNSAIANMKRQKRYNKRTIKPLVCKLKKDLDELLKTSECNDYFMNYSLVGDGRLNWNSVSMSSTILRFRDANIIGGQQFKILNDLRVLSLSFIFVFGHTPGGNPRLCEYLNIRDYSSYCKQVEIPTISNIAAVTSDLFKLQSIHSNAFLDFDVFDYITSTTSSLARKVIMNINTCLPTWTITNMTECQFSDQSVFPLLLPLFLGRRDFEISRFDKSMLAMPDYKPDLLVMLKTKPDTKMDFFVGEVKKSGCTGNKYESDFVKVQREMKAIIDQQINLGVDSPLCYGLLVEGYDCYLYQMSLKHEGEYRSHLVAHFRTLRDVLDTMLLLPAINILSYLDDELTRLRLMILSLNQSQQDSSKKSVIQEAIIQKVY